jgi:cytochrome P450
MAPLLDLASPDFWANPYPSYRRLREEAPVHFAEPIQAWILSRYTDVFAALADPRLSVAYTDAFYIGLPDDLVRRFERFRAALRRGITFSDPPQHNRMRELLRRSFRPEYIEAFRKSAVRLVGELTSEAIARGTLDVKHDFCAVLPAAALAEQLGAGRPDVAKLAAWGQRMLSFFGRLPDDIALAEDTLRTYDEITAYFERLFAVAREDSRESLLTPLLRAGDAAASGERLTHDELVMTCLALLVAGIETVANFICGMIVTLDRHPGELARLRREPDLLPSAIEEIMRFDSPVQSTFRVVREPLEIAGQTLLPGQRVMLLIGSANRDPEHVQDPDRLDIGRREARSVAFGYGPHYCIGAQLARLQAQEVLSAFYLKGHDVRVVTSPVVWEPNLVHRGVRALDVAFV